MANKYDEMMILRSTKTEIKLWLFHLVDVLIIFLPMWLIFEFNNQAQLPLLNFSLLQILWFCFGLFLCVKTKANAYQRNLVIILKLLKMKRKLYVRQNYEWSDDDEN